PPSNAAAIACCSCRQEFTVRGESKRGHGCFNRRAQVYASARFRVPVAKQLAGKGMPQTHVSIFTPGSQDAAIGRESECLHTATMKQTFRPTACHGAGREWIAISIESVARARELTFW